MKILNVRIENFLTIGEIECRLDDKGLVLIQGENEDDSSQSSNGSGKSSFPDAISWCLYGVTARGDSGDSVVNRHVGKNCLVQVHLRDDAHHWIVTRARKHKILKNAIIIEQVMSDGTYVPLTDGTAALTQAKIEQIMGCSADVFAAAVYAGQERMPDLPGMTDKMLKLLVEEAAGINRLQAASELAQIEAKTASAIVVSALSDVEAIERRIETLADDLVAAKADEEDWEGNRTLKLAEIRASMAKRVAVLKTMTPLPDSAPTLAELEEVKARIAGVDAERARLEELSNLFNKAQRSSQLANRDAATMATAAKNLKALSEDSASRLGEPCTECGKPFNEHDLEGLQSHTHAQYELALKQAKALHAEAKQFSDASALAQKQRDDYRAGMTDVSSEIARERVLRDALRAIESDHKDYEHEREMLAASQRQFAGLQAEVNPYTAIAAKVTAQSASSVAALADQHKHVAIVEKEKVIWQAVADCYGRSGVRAHILDTVTPFLNERTNEYLGTLTDGNITALWSTVSINAKGEYKENFNIEVQSKVGAESFRGLSGGEKRKVRLACSMALQDLVSSRATKPIDLFIADEIDDALDEQGLERLMSILDEKAKSKGTVLVISHNSLSDWIRNSVTITKREGKAFMSAGGAL